MKTMWDNGNVKKPAINKCKPTMFRDVIMLILYVVNTRGQFRVMPLSR